MLYTAFLLLFCVPGLAITTECPKERGLCVKADGAVQTEGIIKVNALDGNTAFAERQCLKWCRQRVGATGCQVIWNQANRGCYIHTREVAGGNRADNNMCWAFSKCKGATCQDYEHGIRYPRNDLNKGHKEKTNTPAQCQHKCQLDPRCIGFTWGGKMNDCWIKHTLANRAAETGFVSGERNSCRQVCPAERGYCVTADGADMNEGVIKINELNGNTVEAQQHCLAACQAHEDATGCEVIWDQDNRGCYIHTREVASGNNVARHKCWVFSKCRDAPRFKRAVYLTEDAMGVESNIGKHLFNQKFRRCPVVRYRRNGITAAIYVRTSFIPKDFDAYSLFTRAWTGADNLLNTDFKIYDHYMDAVSDNDGWKYCSNDHFEVGFPGFCGKLEEVHSQWFSMPEFHKSPGITAGVGFDIAEGEDCLSDFDKDYDICPIEKGFCVKAHGGDRNDGVIKVNGLNADTEAARAACLKKCRNRPGATGCEVIWNESDRGCYIHTEEITQGNNVDGHMCWVFSKCRGIPLWTSAVELNKPGTSVVKNIGKMAFNQRFRRCPVVRYRRNDKVSGIYVRTSPIPSSFDAFEMFTGTWRSTDNIMGTDFELYYGFPDAVNQRNSWAYCNYDEPDVGFPGECGRRGPVANRWFSMPGGRFYAPEITDGAGFDISNALECVSDFGEPLIAQV